MTSCGTDSPSYYPAPVERHQTSNSPGERQRGPPEISPAFSVGPQQHWSARSGKPQLTRKPAPRLSDEESGEPAAKGNPWTPPQSTKHSTASTGPLGPNQMAACQYWLTRSIRIVHRTVPIGEVVNYYERNPFCGKDPSEVPRIQAYRRGLIFLSLLSIWTKPGTLIFIL